MSTASAARRGRSRHGLARTSTLAFGANTEDETLGETLERLVDDYTLIDFANDAAGLDPGGSVHEAVDGAVGTPDPDE